MKKIINKHCLLLLSTVVCIYSCAQKKSNNEDVLTSNDILQEVNKVIAIGKVTTENGVAIIASNSSGIVNKIAIKEGDTIRKGDILFTLNNELEHIDVALANINVSAVRNQIDITQKELDKATVTLSYLKDKYLTSKQLYEKQAETKENLLLDETNYLQQQQVVNGILGQLNLNKSQIKEKALSLEKSQFVANSFTITAPQSGVVTTLNLQLGQNVMPSESLGEIINLENLIIEAEVDELFADRVQDGQAVTFVNINTKQIIGEGTIVYTSPILMNKSILYETANEADDRRVRRIKIKPTKKQGLLVNSKIECQIKLH